MIFATVHYMKFDNKYPINIHKFNKFRYFISFFSITTHEKLKVISIKIYHLLNFFLTGKDT